MVRDFEEIKQTIQTWIDRELDHKMLLCRKDPVVPVLQRLGEPMFLLEEFRVPQVRVRVKKRALPGIDYAAVEVERTRRGVLRPEAARRSPERARRD